MGGVGGVVVLGVVVVGGLGGEGGFNGGVALGVGLSDPPMLKTRYSPLFPECSMSDDSKSPARPSPMDRPQMTTSGNFPIV
jgi:hypothetical protein